ncbi:unnamed protein product, partial [Mesorhabditis spiculigera]
MDRQNEAAMLEIAMEQSIITAANEARARAVEIWKREFPTLSEDTIRNYIHMDEGPLRAKFNELSQVLQGKRGTKVQRKIERPQRLAVPINLNIDFDKIHSEQMIEAVWSELVRRMSFVSNNPEQQRDEKDECSLSFFLRDSFVTVKMSAVNRLLKGDFYCSILILALTEMGLGDRLLKAQFLPNEVCLRGIDDIILNATETHQRRTEAQSVRRAKLPYFAEQMWDNFLQLKNFDYKNEMMNLTRFDCPVCFETFNRYDGIHCSQSDVDKEDPEFCHLFCEVCVRHHTLASMEEINFVDSVGVKCLQPGCKGHISLPRLLLILDAEEKATLEKQFTSAVLMNAGQKDFLRCAKCDFGFANIDDRDCIEILNCQNPACMFRQCRNCDRAYDGRHVGRTCAELANAQDAARKREEEELTRLMIRICPKCNREFVRDSGCNKMTCPCGVTQCYLCRASPIGYDHFKNGTCAQNTDDLQVQRRDEQLRQARIKAAAKDELLQEHAKRWE